MKLPWQKTESTPTAGGSTKIDSSTAHEPSPAQGTDTEGVKGEQKARKGYTPPKGRPTPKRQEQEIKRGVIRDPHALTPAQQRERDKELKRSMSKEEWKAHKKQQRQQRHSANREIQARIDAGDERYIFERDKGEVRRFVRDWVDSRRFFNNYVMPAAFVMLLIMFIGSFMPEVSAVLSMLSLLFIVLIFAEAVFIGIRANKAVRARFPETSDTGFGLGMYAFSRASQPRGWRSPKPRVAIGDRPAEN
ncbi:DUF3043 domain-containing protein [Corynebacterium mayonis]|uniref:DUF3043 domain-containing protein n=1 Tax=Corynebacterium mayonis TaxID=3062461 RepID=UPI003140183D